MAATQTQDAATVAAALEMLGYTLVEPDLSIAPVVGFDDDARVELDERAYDEWAAAQHDEYAPSGADERVASIAALG